MVAKLSHTEVCTRRWHSSVSTLPASMGRPKGLAARARTSVMLNAPAGESSSMCLANKSTCMQPTQARLQCQAFAGRRQDAGGNDEQEAGTRVGPSFCKVVSVAGQRSEREVCTVRASKGGAEAAGAARVVWLQHVRQALVCRQRNLRQ